MESPKIFQQIEIQAKFKQNKTRINKHKTLPIGKTTHCVEKTKNWLLEKGSTKD